MAQAKAKQKKKAAAKPAKPASAGRIEKLGEIPLSSIKLSKRFNRHKIDVRSESFKGLVASVKVSGIIQPVLVRQVNGHVELVAGERRYRAAREAKLKTVPAVVRKISDAEAGSLQLTENMWREDLTPVEEALQLKAQIDAGVSTDDLAKQLGKTRRYVQRRVSIANLSARWLKAIAHPQLQVRHWPAMLLEMIAKLPHKAQDELTVGYNGGWDNQLRVEPYPRTSDLLRSIANVTRELKHAPWKRDDAELVKAAGACSSCVKRGSCDPDLWDDLAKAKTKSDIVQRDVCLDADCWEQKTKAHIKHRSGQLAEKHGKVIHISNEYDRYKRPPGSVHSWDVRSCKKSAKGAVPAIVVDGRNAGQVSFVQPANGVRESKVHKANTGKIRPLAERRAENDQKRAKVIYKLLGEQLEKSTLDDFVAALEPHPRLTAGALCTRVMLSLVATFGTHGHYYDLDADTTWAAVDGLITTNKESDAHIHLWEDIRDSLGMILRRGFRSNVLEDPKQFAEDSERIARLIGANLEAMRTAAADKYPEPKSWAKEEADGAA